MSESRPREWYAYYDDCWHQMRLSVEPIIDTESGKFLRVREVTETRHFPLVAGKEPDDAEEMRELARLMSEVPLFLNVVEPLLNYANLLNKHSKLLAKWQMHLRPGEKPNLNDCLLCRCAQELAITELTP